MGTVDGTWGRYRRNAAVLTAVTVAVAGCGVPQRGMPVDPLTAAPSPVPTAAPSPVPTATPSRLPAVVVPPSPSSTPMPSSTPTAAPSPPPPSVAPAEAHLRPGDRGPAVAVLQARLVQLGYWLGQPDGEFGDATRHAVVALQKAAGIGRDGIVGPRTRRALRDRVQPAPGSTDGVVVEVDRERHLVLLVDQGRLVWTFDASTGRPGLATPGGWFHVDRGYDGYRRAPLGVLYRPLYFNGGIAIHGYPSVPAFPASHGCVRVTNAVIDWMWADERVAVGTPVWVR